MKTLLLITIVAFAAALFSAIHFYEKYQTEIIAGAAAAASLAAMKAMYDARLSRSAAQARKAQIDGKKGAAKAKAKCRAGKLISAVPLLGVGYVAATEAADFDEWLQENPNGTLAEYTAEVEAVYAEMWEESKKNGWIKSAETSISKWF